MIQAIACVMFLLLTCPISRSAPPTPSSPYTFPQATPESVCLTTQALTELDNAIKGYIDRDEAVCAELLVIKNRKTILHTAHGQADRENSKPLATGSIFCVRSMTKPIAGTAIQMLIDEGKLSLFDHASKYLPAFDSDTHRDITIAHLLTHTSGLPLSSLIKTDHRMLTSVQDVADLASKATLGFAPGAGFNYSDDGTDTLTAIIEKASGQRADDFIQTRILTPLGMANLLRPDRRARPHQV